MPKPDWQDWALEPWEVQDLAYVHSVPEGDLMFDAWYVGGQEAHRLVACVNALAGIRNPAAVREVLEAARTVMASTSTSIQSGKFTVQEAALDALDAALSRLGSKEPSYADVSLDELREQMEEHEDEIARLDQPPEEA